MKTKKRSKILSLLLALMMLLTMVPITAVTANAAEWTTVNSYEQFEAAMTAEGQRNVRLGADIDTAELNHDIGLLDTLAVKGQKQLDLNGYTLRLFTQKSALGDLIEIKNSSLTLSDSSTAKTGRMLGVTSGDADVLINVWENGKFTMNSGKLEVEVYTGSIRGVLWRRTIDCHYDGEVVINGGTLYVPPKTYEDSNAYTTQFFDEFDDLHNGSCGYTLIANNNSKVTINGGTFQGPVRMNVSNSKWNKTTSRVIITGGTFEKDVVLNGAGSTTGDGKVTLAEIKGGTFLGKVQAWAAASFESSFSTPEVVISGGDFSKEFWLRPKFPLVNNKEQRGVAYHVAAKLNGGTFHEGFSADKNYENYEYSASAVKQRLNASEIYQLADKLLGQNAIQTGNGTFAAQDNNSYNKYITNYRKSEHDSGGYAFIIKAVNNQPTKIIPNAWGMKSVTLDGNPIDYFKDWKGTVERMDNSTAHTLKFEWYPLAQELKDAGYTYRANFDCYTVGSNTPTTSVPISATATEYSHTIPAGAAPSVYPFDLQLNLDKNGSSVGIISNQHIVKLVVNPAPVAHSITVTNGRGTANPTSAMAGETVTVTAKDDTANYMMFTQWYTNTAGVTFTNVNDRVTTFVMPDCDVKVNPGFQQVSFTNQPTDSWLSSVDDSKVYFAFSQPITSWKLVNEDDTTLASGNAESANALVAATLGPKPDKTEMTCRVIVTANGQNFTSRTFDLKWYNVPGAPDVTVYPEGGKFVETLDVKLKTPNTYWGILYTTDGSDPYDKSGETWTKNPTAIEENDSTQVTISKDTTIKACLYNSEGYSNMEKFGDIVTCDFTKVTCAPPVADPASGTSFYDSLNVSLSTDIVNAKIMWSYDDLDVDDLGVPGKWKEYEPEKESITLSGGYGTHGFYALTGIRMERDDGSTYWVHSDKQEYSYPRISYATIADASVVGKVNEEIAPVDVSITLSGDVFAEGLTADTDVSGWFTNLPKGLKATVKEKTNYTKTLVITISGTPTETSSAAISVKMPKSALRYTGTGTAVEQTVLPNSKAVYNIVEDGTHTHTYGAWTMVDDSQHSRSCTAGDDVQFEDHDFSAWRKVDDTNHSRTCSKCTKSGETANYTEIAEHTWVWVVDQEAALNQPGKQHEECTGCHAKRSENTVIPALRDYAVTVTGGTATVAAGTPITRAMEGVEVTVTADAPEAGKVFDKWVVLEGNVTLANANSETTTFTMPASAVSVKAVYKDTYTISFDANGGTGTMEDVTGISGEYTLPANGFKAPAGKQFKAWSVGGVEKAVGDKITVTADTTVTAVWKTIPAGYIPTVQKPEIVIIGSGKAPLSADGTVATITADEGYELVSVVLNGKDMGKVDKLTGLKTGDKAVITFQKKADDSTDEVSKLVAKIGNLQLVARSNKTAKKNVNVVLKMDDSTKAVIQGIENLGYTVKYKFYRSTKRSSGYKAMLLKAKPQYTNTIGEKGTMYYYKARVMVYDKDGNLIAKTELKQCKYANRLWTK